MKISRDALVYGKTIKFDSVKDAVEDALILNGWSYDGQLEKLQSENEKLRELVARLVDTLNLSKVQLEAVLGSSYEVEL